MTNKTNNINLCKDCLEKNKDGNLTLDNCCESCKDEIIDLIITYNVTINKCNEIEEKDKMFKDELELDDIEEDIEGIGITENSILVTDEKENIHTDIPIENSIEKQLKEVPPIFNETNIADVILEKEKLKAEAIQAFLSDVTQKTEVTPSERKVIPLLKQLALIPFPDIAIHKKDVEEQNKILKEFETPFLMEWVDQYINLGIPVNRKGRKEEVDVLKSYLTDDLDIKTNNPQGSFK